MKKILLLFFGLIFFANNIYAAKYTREDFIQACFAYDQAQRKEVETLDTKNYISFDDSLAVIAGTFFDIVSDVLSEEESFIACVEVASASYFKVIYGFFNIIKFGASDLSAGQQESMHSQCPIDRSIDNKIYSECILQGVQDAVNRFDTKKMHDDFLKTKKLCCTELHQTIFDCAKEKVLAGCSKKEKSSLGSILLSCITGIKQGYETTHEICALYVKILPNVPESLVGLAFQDVFEGQKLGYVMSCCCQDQVASGIVSDLGKQLQQRVRELYAQPLITTGIAYDQILGMKKAMRRKFDLYESSLMDLLPDITEKISPDFQELLDQIPGESAQFNSAEKVILEQSYMLWYQAFLKKIKNRNLITKELKLAAIRNSIQWLSNIQRSMQDKDHDVWDLQYYIALKSLYVSFKAGNGFPDGQLTSFENLKYLWRNQQNQRQIIAHEAQSEIGKILQQHQKNWTDNPIIQKQLQKKLMMQAWRQAIQEESDAALQTKQKYETAWINEGERQCVADALTARSRAMQATEVEEKQHFAALKALEQGAIQNLQKEFIEKDYKEGGREICRQQFKEYQALKKQQDEAFNCLVAYLANKAVNPVEQNARYFLREEEQESFIKMLTEFKEPVLQDACTQIYVQAIKTKMKTYASAWNTVRQTARKSIEQEESKERFGLQEYVVRENTQRKEERERFGIQEYAVRKSIEQKETDAWNLIKMHNVKFKAIVAELLSIQSSQHCGRMAFEHEEQAERIALENKGIVALNVLKQALLARYRATMLEAQSLQAKINGLLQAEGPAWKKLQEQELGSRKNAMCATFKRLQQEADVAAHGNVTNVRRNNPYALPGIW